MSIKSLSEKYNAKKAVVSHNVKQKALAGLFGIAGFAGLQGLGSAALNTTAIIETISGVTEIFPSLGDMVVGIVPTILTLAVVGFIIGFFDKILAMVEKFIR